jgi:chromosome segregation ATPase
MSLAHWVAIVQGVFTVLLTVVGVLFAKSRAEQVGREELLKSLAELREQIGDRDRTAIGLREQLISVQAAMTALDARVKQQETQILMLVRENMELKSTRSPPDKPPSRRKPPPEKG